jgi:hypothetical protein
MRDRRADLRADVAAFTVHGEVDDVWKLGGESMEVVLQDGRLRLRHPVEVLVRDARIARLEWRRIEDSREPALVLSGANLLVGPQRLAPAREIALGDGDVLAVDPRDVGEPPKSVVGGLLVSLPVGPRRPSRCLLELGEDEFEVTRPGAGQGLLTAGFAAILGIALPFGALALGRPEHSAARGWLVGGALAAAVAGAVSISFSRAVADSGDRIRWAPREGLTRTTRGLGRRTRRFPPDTLDGIAVRIDRRADDGWHLAVEARARGVHTPLDRGPHLDLPRNRLLLPRLAALEARRRDWIDAGHRIALVLGRAPDSFVTDHAHPDWPPERARGVLAAEADSLG